MSNHLKKKKPLPGYRFIFNAFGVILIVLSCKTVFDLLTRVGGESEDSRATHWITYVAIPVWIGVGVIFLWYAHLLATKELTWKHWKLGWFLIPLGVVTGYGIIFIFMALIWNDADVRA